MAHRCKYPTCPKGYRGRNRDPKRCTIECHDRGPCWTPPNVRKGVRKCRPVILKWGRKIFAPKSDVMRAWGAQPIPQDPHEPPPPPTPIMPVQGVPGGTLLNPVARPVPAIHFAPMPVGTGAVVNERYAHTMAAMAHRGTGHASGKMPVRRAQREMPQHVVNRVDTMRTLVAMDVRNPAYADRVLPGMPVGSTRIRG